LPAADGTELAGPILREDAVAVNRRGSIRRLHALNTLSWCSRVESRYACGRCQTTWWEVDNTYKRCLLYVILLSACATYSVQSSVLAPAAADVDVDDDAVLVQAGLDKELD